MIIQFSNVALDSLSIMGERVYSSVFGTGVISFINGSPTPFEEYYNASLGVIFDKRNKRFHSLGGACEFGYGYYYPSILLEIIDTDFGKCLKLI